MFVSLESAATTEHVLALHRSPSLSRAFSRHSQASSSELRNLRISRLFSVARRITTLLFHRVPFSFRSSVLDGAESGRLYMSRRLCSGCAAV